MAKMLLEGVAGGKDQDLIAMMFDNNLVFEIQGDDGALPWIGGRKTGRKAIADFIQDIRALTQPISFDVEDILASESRAAMVGALQTRINATDKIGSVRVRVSKCSLGSDVRPRLIRRPPGWPLRSQCGGENGACGCWRKHVDEDGSGDGGGCAIHRSLDRTGQPIVGT
jgi:hypothetical protein